MTRHATLAAVFVSSFCLSAVIASCAGTSPTCASCVGCCDATGTCQAGTTELRCGRGGATCVACGLGQICSVGACTTSGSGGGSVSGGGAAGGSSAGGAAGGGSGVGGGAAGGTPMVPPVTACQTSATCDAGQLCVWQRDGGMNGGGCYRGSGRACGAGLTCVNGQGYLGSGDECGTSTDCPVLANTAAQVCSGFSCVALCQYHDDPSLMGCATHPGLGLIQGCSRNHARALVVASKVFGCVNRRIVSAQCRSPSPAFSPQYEAFVTCALARIARGGNCGTLFALDGNCHQDAGLSVNDYVVQTDQHLTLQYVNIPSGGGGSGGVCGSDCDCGHCQYCERGSCYYGGEGPYGCYRGCN